MFLIGWEATESEQPSGGRSLLRLEDHTGKLDGATRGEMHIACANFKSLLGLRETGDPQESCCCAPWSSRRAFISARCQSSMTNNAFRARLQAPIIGWTTAPKAAQRRPLKALALPGLAGELGGATYQVCVSFHRVLSPPAFYLRGTGGAPFSKPHREHDQQDDAAGKPDTL
jgi:hypothetical protein